MRPEQNQAEEYREIAGRFTQLVERVPDDDTWARPAPPQGWTARDVVRHLIEWFPPFLYQGAGITLPTGPDVDQDALAAWRTFSDGVQAVLDDPAAADTVFAHVHTGELPLPQAISEFFTADVFMHTWDLARATGQDDTLDPDRCQDMLADMEPTTTRCAPAASTDHGYKCPTTPTRRPSSSPSSAATPQPQTAFSPELSLRQSRPRPVHLCLTPTPPTDPTRRADHRCPQPPSATTHDDSSIVKSLPRPASDHWLTGNLKRRSNYEQGDHHRLHHGGRAD